MEYEETELPDEAALTELHDRPQGEAGGPRQAAQLWWSVKSTIYHRRGHDYADTGFTLVGTVQPLSRDEQDAILKHHGGSGWEFWQQYLDRQDELLTERKARRS